MFFTVVPAYGPNAFGPELYPLQYGEWRRDAVAGIPFRNIPLDDRGRPHLGHLTHATIPWWEGAFRKAGLRRLGDVEKVLHERFDAAFEYPRRSFFVFVNAGSFGAGRAERSLLKRISALPGLRPIIIIALKRGMRRGEILALTWLAVNFIKSFILIENSKSGKSRKVPMSPAVREVLKALPRIADFIFYNPETKTHIKSVTTAFETARGKDKADLAGLRFHDLRHTFATWCIENGGDIVALSKILGHSSIQMMLRYCNPTEEGMLRAVQKMDGILDSSGQKADSPSEAVVELRPVTILEISH